METPDTAYIAHIRRCDGALQTLSEHLQEAADIAGSLASKIDASEAGELLGLLHDFGKYSMAFQDYIRLATGLINPDHDDAHVDAKALKGKIDHSTAGAQWI